MIKSIIDYVFLPRLFLVRESSVAGGFVISYYFGGRAYHVPIMPHVDPTSSAVTYSLDEGRTKFFDLLQLVEFYQLNKGTLNSRLTHYIVTNNSPSSISGNRSESPNSCRNASDTSLDVGKWFLSRKLVLRTCGSFWSTYCTHRNSGWMNHKPKVLSYGQYCQLEQKLWQWKKKWAVLKIAI